jgi:CBS-domain-containing membrane protein
LEEKVKARDLMSPVASVHPGDPSSELVRHFQDASVRAVAVVDEDDQVAGVVTEEDLLAALIPSYVLADASLARVLEEEAGGTLRQRLEGKEVRHVVDVTRRGRPVVAPDDTLIEVASALASSGAPAVLVVDQGRVLGVIPLNRLLAELCRPR